MDNRMLEQLGAPFAPGEVKWKLQTRPREENGEGVVVAYIDARDVMARLDAVAGGTWSDSYKVLGLSPAAVECQLTVAGVTRVDVGCAAVARRGQDDGDQQQERQTDAKALYSDAFKRAAVKFGIFRQGYALPRMKARTKRIGKYDYLADGELERLRGLYARAVHLEQQPQQPQKPQAVQAVQVARPYSVTQLRERFDASVRKAIDQQRRGDVTETHNGTELLALLIECMPGELPAQRADQAGRVMAWLARGAYPPPEAQAWAFYSAVSAWMGVERTDGVVKVSPHITDEALGILEVQK